MNVDQVLWMLGQAFLLAGIIVGVYVALVQRISRLERASEDVNMMEIVQRVRALEAVLDTFGKDLARRMHRDDDKYNADALLETYISRSYEMSNEEWHELEKVCERVLANPSHTHYEDFSFRFLKALAKHKLTIQPTKAQAEAIAKAKAKEAK